MPTKKLHMSKQSKRTGSFIVFIRKFRGEMRNSLDILEEIRSTLASNKLLTEKQELDSEIRASSTGGELCGRSAYKLLSLQKQNPEIRKTIGHLITEFIEFCTLNGIEPIDPQ